MKSRSMGLAFIVLSRWNRGLHFCHDQGGYHVTALEPDPAGRVVFLLMAGWDGDTTGDKSASSWENWTTAVDRVAWSFNHPVKIEE